MNFIKLTGFAYLRYILRIMFVHSWEIKKWQVVMIFVSIPIAAIVGIILLTMPYGSQMGDAAASWAQNHGFPEWTLDTITLLTPWVVIVIACTTLFFVLVLPFMQLVQSVISLLKILLVAMAALHPYPKVTDWSLF